MVVLLLGSMSLVLLRVRQSEDAAVRQQERVSGDRRHAGGDDARTDGARGAARLRADAQKQPEVVNVQTYAGTASPYNFNGLVRHYFLRRGPNVADIQVNLLARESAICRATRSPSTSAQRLLPVAERYRRAHQSRRGPARPARARNARCRNLRPERRRPASPSRGAVRDLFEGTNGVVDVDWYVEDDQPKYRFAVDQRESGAERNHRQDDDRAHAAGWHRGDSGRPARTLPMRRKMCPSIVRLERASRSDLDRLHEPRSCAGRTAIWWRSARLVRVERDIEDKSIYHKNLMPVTYVTADVAGAIESPVYAILKLGPGDRANPDSRRLSRSSNTWRRCPPTDALLA